MFENYCFKYQVRPLSAIFFKIFLTILTDYFHINFKDLAFLYDETIVQKKKNKIQKNTTTKCTKNSHKLKKKIIKQWKTEQICTEKPKKRKCRIIHTDNMFYLTCNQGQNEAMLIFIQQFHKCIKYYNIQSILKPAIFNTYTPFAISHSELQSTEKQVLLKHI